MEIKMIKKWIISLNRPYTEEIDYTRNEYYSIVNELDNSSKYHEDLIEFNNILITEYPFINASPIIITKKITVFGDSNLEVIKRIFSEYSEFISSSIQEEEFIQNFLIDAPISNKIKLINGTLSDYAYLIREIKPFFIEKYQEATIYNQWWSDRFLFSNKEKNRRDISNMVSALNNDRQATKLIPDIFFVLYFHILELRLFCMCVNQYSLLKFITFRGMCNSLHH